MPPDTSAIDGASPPATGVPRAIREVARALVVRKLGLLFSVLLVAALVAQAAVLWALSGRPPARLYVPEATSLRPLRIEGGSRHE